jgi:hypothetical protein
VLDLQGVRTAVDLRAVDAPELAQPFGPEARALISDLALDREVTVELAAPAGGAVPAGRAVVDGTDLAVTLLAAGLAWHDTIHDSTESLVVEQIKARSARVGLWSDPEPVAPWVWREAHAPTPVPAKRPASLSEIAGAYELEKDADGRTVITQPTPSPEEASASRRDERSQEETGGAPARRETCCCRIREWPSGHLDGPPTIVHRWERTGACHWHTRHTDNDRRIFVEPEGCVPDSVCD